MYEFVNDLPYMKRTISAGPKPKLEFNNVMLLIWSQFKNKVFMSNQNGIGKPSCRNLWS